MLALQSLGERTFQLPCWQQVFGMLQTPQVADPSRVKQSVEEQSLSQHIRPLHSVLVNIFASQAKRCWFKSSQTHRSPLGLPQEGHQTNLQRYRL